MSDTGEERDAYDEINITPMLDLAYVLLVIFIIMTTASVQGIKVNLPKASETPAIAKAKTKAISITSDGTIYLDTYPVTPHWRSIFRVAMVRDYATNQGNLTPRCQISNSSPSWYGTALRSGSS